MPDGYLYSNILLKLYLRSLKYEGRLMFNNRIPFNSTMLAQVTRHSVGTVEKAMQVFRELELIEVLDSGAIYITDIQNFIGQSSTEADRIREYRKRINKEKQGVQMLQQTNDKGTPEIELETEIDIELEIEEKPSPLTKNVKERIINSWNELGLQELRSIRSGTDRQKSLKARIEDYSFEEVMQAIESIKDSSFLQGDNDRNWVITFDWFVRPNNFPKVLEGNYIDKKSKPVDPMAEQDEDKPQSIGYEGSGY